MLFSPVFQFFKTIREILYEVDLQVDVVNLAKYVLAVKFEVALLLRILLYSKFKTFGRNERRVSNL